MVLNKIDKIGDNEVERSVKEFQDGIPVSALNGTNFDLLIDRVALYLNRAIKTYKFVLPQSKAKIISLMYKKGHVVKREYRNNQVHLEVQLPVNLYNRIKKDIK